MAVTLHKNFIDTYENKIKRVREEYYRNNVTRKSNINIDFTLIAVIIVLVILVMSNFSLKGYITSLIATFILNIIFRIISQSLGIDKSNNYLREIKRLGYFSINAYEKSLRKYVTGPNGYYERLLEEIKKQYNLTDQVRKISGARGEEYYIWLNSDQDCINLLNERTIDKPEVISIRLNNIRYFRVDEVTKTILLKTDIEYYRFQLSALDIFNEILKNKRFDNIKTFNPEEYISDFEIYMHNFEKRVNGRSDTYKYSEYDVEFSKMIVYFILLIVGVGLDYVLNYNFLKFIPMIILILLNYSFSSLLSSKKMRSNNENDLLKLMNTDEGCIERFNELKVSLGIYDTYDKIYSKDNACYYTWVANGYFHVFLNVIYTNVLYMAVKVSDVAYYRKVNNECIVKLKDRTLEFRKDAKTVFDKILPNRDYDWLKGYQQR